MRYFVAFILSSAAISAVAKEVDPGQIDGSTIKAYDLTWQQCVKQEDKWVNQGRLAEDLVVIGESVLRHRQTNQRPDGGISVSTTFFDRHSFSPLRMETNVTGPDGKQVASLVHILDATGYTGVMMRGDDSKQLSGKITSKMFHGGALGLPLAAMTKPKEAVSFDASMMGFDATYKVEATWVGTETLMFGDQKILTQLVDVEWHHQESGDIYPPGPDASGGRYWIVSNPPPGFPNVPRYKTDTYAVEFVPGACPE